MSDFTDYTRQVAEDLYILEVHAMEQAIEPEPDNQLRFAFASEENPPNNESVERDLPDPWAEAYEAGYKVGYETCTKVEEKTGIRWRGSSVLEGGRG